ncbi:MAG: signal peptidase II [Rhabdochlamydiaceae bacterium]
MNWRRLFQLLALIVPIFALDYVSKAWVNFSISPVYFGRDVFPFGGIPIFHNFLGIDFCINHVFNHGAAWGLFSSMQNILLVVRIGVIVGLISYMIFSPKSTKYHFPLSLIVGGAIGNVVDYFVYGHVVDMFHFIFWGHSFAVFNVADSAIFCGIAWMILRSFVSKAYVPSKS